MEWLCDLGESGNESTVVLSHAEESPNTRHVLRSGEVPDCFGDTEVRLEAFCRDDMPKVLELLPHEHALCRLQLEVGRLQLVDYFL